MPIEQLFTLWNLAFVLVCLWLDIAAYWLLVSGEVEEYRRMYRDWMLRKWLDE